MKKLIIAFALSAAFSPAQADTSGHKVDLIFGGYSSHMLELDYDYKFNESHNMIGLIYNDDLTLVTFENSYYNRSILLSYKWDLYEYDINSQVKIGLSVSTGLVTGYTADQVGAAYLGGGVSLHVLPALSISYQITNDLAFHIDNGVIPADNGIVYTNNFRLSYKF